MPPRRSRWVIAAIVLLLLSGIGIRNGYTEWSGAETAGQRLATWTEVGYGILGPLSALAVFNTWSGARALLVIWALCLTLTASLAPVAWGDSPLWTGFLSGASAVALALWVIWMTRRPAPVEEAAS